MDRCINNIPTTSTCISTTNRAYSSFEHQNDVCVPFFFSIIANIVDIIVYCNVLSLLLIRVHQLGLLFFYIIVLTDTFLLAIKFVGISLLQFPLFSLSLDYLQF
jgi:hypothetical protein